MVICEHGYKVMPCAQWLHCGEKVFLQVGQVSKSCRMWLETLFNEITLKKQEAL